MPDATPNSVVANEAITLRAVRAAAGVVRACYPLSGCGNRDLIDRVGSTELAARIQTHFHDRRVISVLSEGKKDEAPSLDEGAEFGSSSDGVEPMVAVSDPVECTGEYARKPSRRTRGSMSLLLLAPCASVPAVYSGCRALKVVLPPDAPVGPNAINIESPPADIVRILCARFGRHPGDLVVWILKRPWNELAIHLFREAGAQVREIPAGDFEAAMLAARPVRPGRCIHISYGVGGLPEGFLVVPYLLQTGGTIMLRPDPLEQHRSEIRAAGCEWMLGRVFDARSMVTSDDCLLVVAGLTDSRVVSGPSVIRERGVLRVHVRAASPRFASLRQFEVAFPLGARVTEVAK